VPTGKKLVTFVIRSVEGNYRNRETIRQTWLAPDQWTGFSDLIVHTVFLVSKSQGKYPAIDYEATEYQDILLIETRESGYISYLIETAFLNFIRRSCSKVDFVFRGNDNSMGMGCMSKFMTVLTKLRATNRQGLV